ncbi:MAG: phosphoadenylyl-sulfate reductase [Alphaproteobacteria bacterium]|nr:MAG: phosphoadenylyl-sulfate reductase [Alphaproteobacteria bacterium]
MNVQALPTAPEDRKVSDLVGLLGKLEGRPLLEALLNSPWRDEVAVVSSFGAESAVLLHMIAQVDPTVPVIFLNTGKLFGETLRYRDRVQARLGLTDVRSIGPHPLDEGSKDPEGMLWQEDNDACCHFRKVVPLQKALKGFSIQITGRKRFQTGGRKDLPSVEIDVQRGAGNLKINPLVNWSLEELTEYIELHNIPKHPLVKEGFLSIGCMPCTERVQPGGGYRDGRWSGSDKQECGIHLVENVDGDGI